jgi:hypothetical protein
MLHGSINIWEARSELVEHAIEVYEGDRAFKLRFRSTPEYGGYVKYPYGAPQRGCCSWQRRATAQLAAEVCARRGIDKRRFDRRA